MSRQSATWQPCCPVYKGSMSLGVFNEPMSAKVLIERMEQSFSIFGPLQLSSK